VPIWVSLTYAVPGALMLSPHPAPIAPEVNGSWFLWVVGTQSLAVAATTLASRHPGLTTALAPLAVALWGIGVIWYLILAVLVTLRLLTTTANPYTFSPAYWIYMGATAITVLAGARILTLPAQLPVMSAVAGVSGLIYLLWAFGTWWVPLLVVFGVWRHVPARRTRPLRNRALEHGLPARHVPRREHPLRPRRTPHLHDLDRPGRSVGRGHRLGRGHPRHAQRHLPTTTQATRPARSHGEQYGCCF